MRGVPSSNDMRALFKYFQERSQVLASQQEKKHALGEIDALAAAARRLSALKDHGGALRLFEKVLELAPDSGPAYLAAGLEALAMSDVETARDHLLLALHYQPGRPEVI